jgi:hypothetical protein
MTESLPGSPQRSADTIGGCLLMLWGSIGGYGTLGALAVIMLRQDAWALSFLDVLYLVVAVTIPIAQRICRTSAHQEPGPPPSALPKRHLAIHFGVTALLWAAARSFDIG